MRDSFATVIAARLEEIPNKAVDFNTLFAAAIIPPSLSNETALKLPRYPGVPAIRLDRLAVDASLLGQHIGSRLVLNALRRSGRNEPAWAMFQVDAKSESASIFYERFLFQRFPGNISVV